jgi:diacylglycerol kinase (ATP)
VSSGLPFIGAFLDNTSMRPLVIVNPRSGGGLGDNPGRLHGVRAVLERRVGPTDVVSTTHRGHAIDLAREAALAGRTLIVAFGGDGTLHEVANGVLDAGRRTAVGYIGQGTGGDFRRTLGIEHRLDAYVDAIAAGRDQVLDVGKVRYRAFDGSMKERWFVNIVSAGISGLVDRYVAGTSKTFGGPAAYLWASTRALAECQRARLKCTVDLRGERRDQVTSSYMFAICNGRYFGAGMHVAPMAKPDDGRFDVVSIDAPSKLAFPGTMRRLHSGTHLTAPGARQFGCDRITVDLDNERARDVFLLDVDGEPLGGLPFEVTLAPKALTIRGPSS